MPEGYLLDTLLRGLQVSDISRYFARTPGMILQTLRYRHLVDLLLREIHYCVVHQLTVAGRVPDPIDKISTGDQETIRGHRFYVACKLSEMYVAPWEEHSRNGQGQEPAQGSMHAGARLKPEEGGGRGEYIGCLVRFNAS